MSVIPGPQSSHRHEAVSFAGVVERNWYLIKRYGWWELAFFFDVATAWDKVLPCARPRESGPTRTWAGNDRLALTRASRPRHNP